MRAICTLKLVSCQMQEVLSVVHLPCDKSVLCSMAGKCIASIHTYLTYVVCDMYVYITFIVHTNMQCLVS